jgi:hypothetical protein
MVEGFAAAKEPQTQVRRRIWGNLRLTDLLIRLLECPERKSIIALD